MSPAQRQQPVAVISRLLEAPHGFGFFQALRLLERWLRVQEGVSSAETLGRRIAVRNALSLSFPASEIADLAIEGELSHEDGVPRSRAVKRIELTPAFIGLLGVAGTLPRYYTELFAERETFQRDRAGRAFLDIFLHRTTVLFYQAWRKHRLPVQFESDRHDGYLPLVLAVAGLGSPALRNRLHPHGGGVADDALAHFAGMLQSRPLSAAMLQRVLQRYFAVPVRLDSFVGRWYTLPAGNQSHLGLRNVRLGHDLVMGDRIWQRDLRMRLTFGPLARAKFTLFLPGGPAALALKELLGLLGGAALEYEVRLTLRAEDVRGIALDGSRPSRLGWDSFLATKPEQSDRSDVGYDLLALAS